MNFDSSDIVYMPCLNILRQTNLNSKIKKYISTRQQILVAFKLMQQVSACPTLVVKGPKWGCSNNNKRQSWSLDWWTKMATWRWTKLKIYLRTFKRSWYLGAASSAALAEPSLCWECRPPHLASPHSGGDWSHHHLHDRHQHDHLQHRLKGDLDDLLCHLARVWLHLLLRRGKKLVSSSPILSFLQCVTGVYDFPSALLFSVETMTTIG